MQDDIATDTGRSVAPVVLALWSSYVQSRDQYFRKMLIDHYLELAKMHAARLYKLRPNDSVSFDDYLQYARTGLLESIDRFDPARNVRFESFAAVRIRGAVLNGLELETEQAAQRKVHSISSLTERLESLRGHESKRNLSMLDTWVDTVVSVAMGLLLETGEDSHQADEEIAANPYASVELLHLRRKLMSGIGILPSREAMVVRLHYFEHQEFQFIAEEMKLSKGRISQLHAQALSRLKKIMRSENDKEIEL